MSFETLGEVCEQEGEFNCGQQFKGGVGVAPLSQKEKQCLEMKFRYAGIYQKLSLHCIHEVKQRNNKLEQLHQTQAWNLYLEIFEQHYYLNL